MNQQLGFELVETDGEMTEGEARHYLQRINEASQSLMLHVATFKRKRGYAVLGYKNLVDCIRAECPVFAEDGDRKIYLLADAGEVLANISESDPQDHFTISEKHLRPIAQANLRPQEQREVWQRAVESAPNGKVTGPHVSATVEAFRQENQATVQPLVTRKPTAIKAYTMDEWERLTYDERDELMEIRGTGQFNSTNDNVEWARWTWNPITGCLHNCAYCYARDIANHIYKHLPDGERFTPAFYPDRLSFPENTKAPDVSRIEDPVTAMGLRNVFTCSMADLFGKWVPTAWIEAVLQKIADNPQWTFLLLTKFPIRMAEFTYPPNTWIGTTVDTQYAVERAEKAFTKIRGSGYQGVAWLSCEPMMERLTFSSLAMFDWLVMGGASVSSQTPAFAPPLEWWMDLWRQAQEIHLPVYMKTNLIQQDGRPVAFDGRVREYPRISGRQ
jgi:protein gp37